MKKALLWIIALALLILSCGMAIAEEEAGEAAEAPAITGMENPWTDVETAEEAADGAGVGYFNVPENETESSGGMISWYGFRYMTGIAEADGGIGSAELIVRKGLNQDYEDVSGDYNEYAFEWTVETELWTVNCYGNEEGRAMKAIWLSDNFSYSIYVRGQGDIFDTYGIDEEAVKLLVEGIE